MSKPNHVGQGIFDLLLKILALESLPGCVIEVRSGSIFGDVLQAGIRKGSLQLSEA
jgi:hypothetical protein